MDVEQVARICHQANKAYCEALGDFSQANWEDSPDWQKNSAINGVNFHLGSLRQGFEPQPSASHESWWSEKVNEGWVYGPVKNPDLKQHPCCVPYEQLPVEQRGKDYVFSGVVASLYSAGLLA